MKLNEHDVISELDKSVELVNKSDINKIIGEIHIPYKKYKTININEKICTQCEKKFNIDNFILLDGIQTKTCINCRKRGKVQDEKRANNPDRIKNCHDREKMQHIKKTRKNWYDNNTEYKLEYSKNHRLQKKRHDPDKFLQHNAILHRQYVDLHPELKKTSSIMYRTKIENRLKVYKTQTLEKNRIFILEDNDAVNLFLGPCFYCGA